MIFGALNNMPKKSYTRRRKRVFNLRRVRTTPAIALSTLASAVAVKLGMTGAAPNTYRAVSVSQVWDIIGMTGGEGPILVGYAHSDYTVTEIKEAIESSASIDPGLKIEQEKSNRLIRIVGQLDQQTNNLNDGKPLKTRLNWLISPGDEVSIFAYNDGAAALTTGAVVKSSGNLWVRDSV